MSATPRLAALVASAVLLATVAAPGVAAADPDCDAAWCEQYRRSQPRDPSTPTPVSGSGAPSYASYRMVLDFTGSEVCARIEVTGWSSEPPPADQTLEAARADLADRLETPLIYYHAQTSIDVPACAGPEVEFDVRGVAIAAWAALTPPSFSPRIAPGRALTGMPAYVELDGTTSASEVVPLPDGLGSLRIDASVVEHEIDFGDGSAPVVTTGLGAPWNGDPSQQIRHVYTDTGARTVTVATTWSATFTAPGQSDALTPRVETAALPLQVNQVQSVRVGR